VLLPALRSGASAVRRAGWPAYAVALLAGLPDLIPSSALSAPVEVALFPVVGLARTILFLGLIRVLAAHRAEPVPPPPAVDASGVRTVTQSVVPPVGDEDRRLAIAMRRAALLGRPALRLFAITLLGSTSAALIALGLLGANGLDIEDIGSREPIAVLPVALLSALLLSFVAMADQRVALEGDPRVLLAAAHSVRIAMAAYASVYFLVLLAVSPGTVGALLPAGVDGLGYQVPRIVVGALVQLLVLGALNEVYVRGPRADLVVDAARPL